MSLVALKINVMQKISDNIYYIGSENGIEKEERRLTKLDLFCDGLSGGSGSSLKRAELAKALGFPHDMSANALLAALKMLISYDEYTLLIKDISENI